MRALKMTIDPLTARTAAIAMKVAEKNITRKLREIEDAVKRKCVERKVGSGSGSHAS